MDWGMFLNIFLITSFYGAVNAQVLSLCDVRASLGAALLTTTPSPCALIPESFRNNPAPFPALAQPPPPPPPTPSIYGEVGFGGKSVPKAIFDGLGTLVLKWKSCSCFIVHIAGSP